MDQCCPRSCASGSKRNVNRQPVRYVRCDFDHNDYLFDKWEHERKPDVLRKVVGDFSGWDKDAVKYDKAFDKLLKGLQAENARA
jgi:hypothetical protein